MWEDRVGFKEFWGQVCDAFCSSSQLPGETPEEYAARQKALEDAQEWQNIYRRAVDGHNCQLADTQQQGRLLGHGVQLFAGPKVLNMVAKVAGRIGGAVKGAQVAAKLEEVAALQRVQVASTAATRAKAIQAADKGKAVVQTGQAANEMVSSVSKAESLLGTNFGKLGTVTKNPNIKISEFSRHGVNQAITRQLSPQTLQDTVQKSLVILQQSGGNYLYLTEEAVVVLNPGGRIVTAYPKSEFKTDILKLLEELI